MAELIACHLVLPDAVAAAADLPTMPIVEVERDYSLENRAGERHSLSNLRCRTWRISVPVPCVSPCPPGRLWTDIAEH